MGGEEKERETEREREGEIDNLNIQIVEEILDLVVLHNQLELFLPRLWSERLLGTRVCSIHAVVLKLLVFVRGISVRIVPLH